MRTFHFVYPCINTAINGVLARIIQDFPCFISTNLICDYNWTEVSINCRAEDFPAIEQRIVSYL